MSRQTLFIAVLLLALLGLVVAWPRRAAEQAPAPVTAASETPGLEPKPIHEVRERDAFGAPEYLLRNLVAGTIEVRCSLEAADNVRAVPPLPRRLVVPARAEVSITILQSADPSKPASAAVACSAMVGDPGARPVAGRVYALPFAAGTRFTVDQGFGGSFSHDSEDSRYSIDFGVPEGTPVLAARAGTVVQVEDDFRAGGRIAARYGDRANYVRVVHDDGSMAVYAHLAPGSMLRRPGDRVALGQLVGKSGNTGFSTGPHLHFSVQRNAGMALQSIPFEVVGVDPRAPVR